LRYLVNDVEEEHNQLLEKYKQTVDRVISDLMQESAAGANRSPQLRESLTSYNYQNNLEQINQQLQEDL